MNLRPYVVYVYIIAFLISVLGIVSIPAAAWQYIADWQKALFAFYVLVGFCGVLIAYWVYEDKHSLEWLENQRQILWQRMHAIEETLENSSSSLQ